MKPILFLDFDGVIRVDDDNNLLSSFDFSADRIGSLYNLVRSVGAEVVVTSDWRTFESESKIRELISPLDRVLHQDWATRVTGSRWQEIQLWLMAHPGVEKFAVLDDYLPHFEGATRYLMDKLVLCSNRYGYIPHKMDRKLEDLLRPRNQEVPPDLSL